MTVRRVFVALATSDRAARVVREAARVASRFDARLEGLFLEDEDLLRLAAHSFASQVGAGGSPRALDASDLEREWRAVAHELREVLQREAERRQLETAFEVRRGRASEAVSRDLSSGDVVVLGWGGWSPAARRAAPIRVLFDGSEPARRALETGAQLAGGEGRLSVWVVDSASVHAVRDELGARVARLRVAAFEHPSIQAVRHVLMAQPGGLLLLPAGCPLADALASRSEEARFPTGVLVVH